MGSSTRFLFLFSPPPPLLLRRRHYGDLTNLRRIHRRVALPCSLSTFCPEARHPRRLSVPSPLTPPPPIILALSFRRLHTYRARFSAADSFPTQRYPLPEWSELLHALSGAGYFSDSIQTFGAENDVVPNFPDELFRPAYACLALARDRPNLLPLLSKIDVELVVENVTPFLFKNGEDSVRKMTLYLRGGGHGTGNMLDMDTATTVDLMRYLLSYVGNFTYSHGNNPHNQEITELSVRRLLSEIAKLSFSTSESNVYGMVQNQFLDRRGQAPRSFQQNVEMKRGDWICPRCNFMNFARNVKCLECEEARPKRQLTGGEWECPQCDFYNYGRNTVCLRCDCKKPGEISLNSANYGYSDNQDLKRRLAENEEKAQRWFSKVSQLESSTSDMSNAIKDEDFPEIMPLRKGVNRFVVSTRKTPLERRLANAQNRINLGGNGTGNENKMPKTKTWGRLDEILGSSSSTDSESADKNASSRQFRSSPQSDPEFVPFVPLPADMFAKKPEEPDSEKTEMGIADNNQMGISEKNQNVGSTDSSKLSSDKINEAKMDDMEEKEEEGKPARWFKRVSELHNVSDGATSEEDFPEIMPMRRGENQFVVSRRKDRSLTSPAYKRRAAMEQAKDSNFVPFVPFPPDYFAKKKQSGTTDSVPEASGENPAAITDDNYGNASKAELTEQSTSKSYSWNNAGTADFTPEASGENSAPVTDNNYRNASQVSDAVKRQAPGHANRTYNDGLLKKEQAQRPTGMTERTEGSRNWENSWSGKSLEGSAVKEPDPLDMSEEAKAERWFRRVAQIKDISELSQIPDEDFPSIMPMRKGVNRFVVSRRKTPLERRLASQHYRRNSPAESSDPPVKGDK